MFTVHLNGENCLMLFEGADPLGAAPALWQYACKYSISFPKPNKAKFYMKAIMGN